MKTLTIHPGVYLLVIACLSTSIPFTAYGDDKDTGVLKIGTIFPMSGRQKAYGQEALMGIRLALEAIGKHDPELARRIQIVETDNRSSPKESSHQAERLITHDRVSLLIGAISDSSSKEIAKVAAAKRKPLIVPASSNEEIAKIGSGIFQTCNTDSFQGETLAKYALVNLGVKRAAVLSLKGVPYSQSIAKSFEKKFLSSGGSIVAKVMVAPRTEAFEAQLKNGLAAIAQEKPEVLLVPGYYRDIRPILDRIGSSEIQTTLLGTDGWDHPRLSLLRTNGSSIPNYYTVHFSPLIDSPLSREFVTAFQRRMNRLPSSLAAMTFDATLVAAYGYKTARGVRYGPLIKGIGGATNLDGITGPMTFQTTGNIRKPFAILRRSGKGKFLNTMLDPLAVLPAKKDTKTN